MNKIIKREKIAVVDGNSLVYRAFFAIRNPMITSRGVYTHAIFGFLNMLSRALDDANPDYIAIAFDRKAPTFRHLEYDRYKAGRAKTPDELSMQLPYLKEILEAMRITTLEMDGFEADDLIGTLAKRADESGMETLVITGDRDELQLVNDAISVLITKKGVSEFELFTPDAMREKYGFEPELFVDYKGLMGDASDNIPGLPGVGEKTAAKLVQDFGSIENIVEHLDEVKPDRIRGILKENQQIAFMSKRLATIVTNAPVDIDFTQMRRQEPDIGRLREIYTELEFKSFLKKLDSGGVPVSRTGYIVDEYTAEQPSYNAIEFNPELVEISIIDGIDGLADIREALAETGTAALGISGSEDHVSDPLVFAINIYVKDRFFCIWTRSDESLLLASCEMLAQADIGLIGFDLKNALYCIRRALAVRGKEQALSDFRLRAVFDAGVANYLLAPGGSAPTFAQIALTYGNILIPEPPDFSQDILAYDKDDIASLGRSYCMAAAALESIMGNAISNAGLQELFNGIEMPLTDTLAEIETNGFSYDAAAMGEIELLIVNRIEELTASIIGLAGEKFNINSPKQLGDILFDKLGLKGGKKNKNGYSTSADILDKLKTDHPIIEQVLEYRMLVKLKGTYIDGLPSFVCADGKIRAHLMQTVAATGRLSCVDPNLQNIPIRKEPGRQLRKAFVPESTDYILMGADYSQIELRVLAHLSEDPALVEDFTSGADIHSRTAARVFGVVDEKDVTDLQRSGAKAVNFGIIYGMSSFGLSEELSIPRKDAERYIQDYFRQHTAVKAFMDDSVSEARSKGYTTTIYGRRRPIPEIAASQYMVRQLGERLAMNSPVQGSAADIIKIAMNRVCAALKAEGLVSKLILQVHDELILQVRKGEEEAAAAILKREMEGAASLKVPLEASVKTGANWYDLK